MSAVSVVTFGRLYSAETIITKGYIYSWKIIKKIEVTNSLQRQIEYFIPHENLITTESAIQHQIAYEHLFPPVELTASICHLISFINPINVIELISSMQRNFSFNMPNLTVELISTIQHQINIIDFTGIIQLLSS